MHQAVRFGPSQSTQGLHCNTRAEKQKPSYLVLEHKGNVHLEVKLVS